VDRVEILGCKLDVLDGNEAAARIMTFAREGTGAQVVTLGTEMVVHAQSDERFRNVVNASALSLCDTVGVLSVARRRGADLHERVTGIELVERLCAQAAREELPVYFLGGAEGAAADAAGIMEARFPGLIVAGTRNGFFADDEVADIVAEIRASGAKLLFVGLGSPRQELWLAEHLRETGAGAAVGVGGSFDVLGGRVTRAPRFMRRLGLEWFYRLVKEPRRWRRQLALPYFVWLVALDGFGFSHKKGVANS
jgi:N-acetylglucosaminyldiphosphoundecaprenol N-acetyl-beta-D-mannosaminyltransferase